MKKNVSRIWQILLINIYIFYIIIFHFCFVFVFRNVACWIIDQGIGEGEGEGKGVAWLVSLSPRLHKGHADIALCFWKYIALATTAACCSGAEGFVKEFYSLFEYLPFIIW